MLQQPTPNDGVSRPSSTNIQPRRGSIPRWLEQARHARSRDARDAWGTFLSISRSGKKGRKLTLEERSEVAQRLYRYYHENKARLDERGVTISQLCQSAFDVDDSKEWYRLTLPEGVDPLARGIRANGWKYVQMIEAFSQALGDSRQQIADQLLRDTSLDPYCRSTKELNEMERLQASLSRIVCRIDSEFELFSTYQQTEKIRQMEIQSGGTLCWPFYDLDMPSSLTTEESRAILEMATDPDQAYYQLNDDHGRILGAHRGWWTNWHGCGHLQGDEFFYVPHAPLGHALIWDLPYRRNDSIAYQLAIHQQLAATRSNPENLKLPSDEWDDITKRPVGQTMSRNDMNAAVQYHFWLLAYPHPDGSGVVPTLYQAGEEGGAYVAPIDMNVIEMLRDAVWISTVSHESMLDRLTNLLTDGGDNPEGCSIERALKRTATWLRHNPILKRHQAQNERSRALDSHLRRN